MHGPARWKLAISTTALGPDATIETIIAEALRAGFDAIEPRLGPGGDLPADAPDDALRAFAQRFHASGLEISALVLAESSSAGLTAADPHRHSAADGIRAGLNTATLVGADTLIVTLTDPPADPQPHPAFAVEKTFRQVLEAMLSLRFDAQRRAVHLALRSGSDRILTSPQESRGFLDRINSPWVGACLDLSRQDTSRDAARWIETLGHRLRSVRFQPSNETDPHSVLAALRRAGYAGPVTCLNDRDVLADVVSRIRAAMG